MEINGWIEKLDGFIWGWFLIVLILGTGILLTVRTRAVQLRHLGKAFQLMFQSEGGASGEVSSFGALCTALSATIGTGNIIGVATAVSAGGPGALLWMLIAAFFGMATKYAEGVLAIKYRTTPKNGPVQGGPFYYIERGLKQVLGGKWRWLGKLFALFGALAGILGIGTITQVSGISAAADRIFPGRVLFWVGSGSSAKSVTFTAVICGVVVTVCTALVIFGGVQRISKVSGIVVPFMAVAYVLVTLFILLCNLPALPGAMALVVKSAFQVNALGGAVTGITLKTVIQKGVGRGIFSNEAGLGSAPIAAAAAKTNSAVRQGLVTMTGTFIDTVIICTLTGLSIVVTGAWNPAVTGKSLQGFEITAYAFEKGLPFENSLCITILSVCLIFFAFTTILGWNYYAERCAAYFVGEEKPAFLLIFRLLYILAVAVGPYLTVSAVWNIADIFNGLMALPNLVALIFLSGVVGRETRAYFEPGNMQMRPVRLHGVDLKKRNDGKGTLRRIGRK